RPLVEALALTGTGSDALLRPASSALLSATHPRVAYPLTARQVIDQTNAALASGNLTKINTLRTTLDGYNNLGSDLNQQGDTNGPLQAAGVPAGSPANVPLTNQSVAPIVPGAGTHWTATAAPPGL